MKKQYQTQTTTVCESALFRTTTTVIKLPEATILVDPNWLPYEIELIRTSLLTPDPSPDSYRNHLLFTHSDYDHIIGYRAFPGAKVIATDAFVNNPDKEKVLQQIRDFDDEYYIQRDYPIEYPEVDIVIREDGQTMELSDHQFTFFLSPGHNRDGMFTLIEPQGILIAGDYLSNVEFPFIYHSISDYQLALNKAEQLILEGRVKLLVPGHGDCTEDISEMRQRLEDSRRYISELVQSVKTQQPFPLERLWEQYDFPGIMTKFHKGNLELAKKELGV